MLGIFVNFEDHNTDTLKLMNQAFAHLFKKATIMITGRSEIEVNKYVRPVFTILRVLTNNNRNFSSYFDKIKEDNITDTTLKKIPIYRHTKQNNNGKTLAN